MPISHTTFEERLARIAKGETEDVAAKVGKPKRKRRSFRARLFTFPCLVGIGILTGGTAYAWVATDQGMPDVMVGVQGMVITNMQWVMALAG